MIVPVARVTLQDVAEEAGVSLATVDRVLNGRPGVRDRTVERVQSAIDRLGYRPDPLATRLARNETFRFCFIMPAGTNSFMRLLEEQIAATADWLAWQRAFIDVRRVDVFDPETLAQALEGLDTRYRGVAVVALDHPRVRGAIDDLVGRGVAVVTLVSDAPTSRRLRYVGIDNTAAGRTAGALMGRFASGRQGTIGVVAGSLALRDHAERLLGFFQVITGEFEGLRVLAAEEGRDDIALTQKVVEDIIERNPDLVGIYNAGAGLQGLATAARAAGRDQELIIIGHELTGHSRRLLLHGVIDAIINQDPGHEARSAARVLLAHCSGEPIVAEQERIRIDIFLRDNLP
ncbi:LacI family DNA-binding transcriptional regulator [Chelatococcus asaccharovorans]|uniref:LacI family DNA-binding transcriptional regulator n=1 Tax=Chelatococcus asaccharovorans TaxID=28210 RepID=UPI00224C78C5|nr:LacI family DNA-binding transcriptional regulator [Chelatococcus asaccharovorans]CAH1673276.1 Novel Xylose regulator from LacI family [Chelatococcus asaccharovorans]CAH1675339.1 Novel Xylose regulator from LacI family [Chelatococcus asaccharovorans]